MLHRRGCSIFLLAQSRYSSSGHLSCFPSLRLFQPWMKDFLYFLKSEGAQESKALAKKIFLVTTNVTANAGRKKRAGEENTFVASCCESSGGNTAVTLHLLCFSANSEGNTDHPPVPTAQLIEELELGNVYWTPEQLDQMSNRTFVTTLEILGNVPNFSADQLAVLGKKATEVQLSQQL